MSHEIRHLVLVPHTHWDREWYRTHEEFRVHLVRLVDRVLDLLEGDPRFRHFMLDGQAIVLDDYLAVRPQAAERITKLVEAGRLLVGPWYVLPDEWLVSGEALIRNLRAGMARADRAGGSMRVGYVPDQFGHVGQLPQIFAGLGLDSAVLWRGVGADVEETLFHWEAPDGTRLFAVYLARSYSNGGHLPRDPGALAERLREETQGLADFSRIPSALLMNGVDHAQPDETLPATLEAARSRLPGMSFEIGTLPGFIERARREAHGELPVHCGEFRSGLRAPLLPGCASTRMPQKRADFENDRSLTRYLEPLAAWLATLGGDADPQLIDFTWRVALENHPHDSICGCSIDAVHDQMDQRFARVADLARTHLERVCVQLSQHLGSGGSSAETDPGKAPGIAVWNPGVGGRTPIEVALEVDADSDERAAAVLHVRGAGGERLATGCELLEPARDVMAFELPRQAAQMLLGREWVDFLGGWLQHMSWRREGDRLYLQLHLGRVERRDSDLVAGRAALRELLAREDAPERVALRARTRARVRLRFVDNLPGCGLRRYVCAPGRGPRAADLSAEKLADGSRAIANAHWRVEVSPRGEVALVHRAAGLRVDDALRIVSEGDRGDEYNFDPVPDSVRVERPEQVRVGAGRRAAESATLEIRARYRVPEQLAPDRAARSARTVSLPVRIAIRLFTQLDRVDFELEVDNRARDHRLRVLLRAPFAARRFQVESAFEVAERPIAPESEPDASPWVAERPIGATPQRSFATLDDGVMAATVANRGLAEAEALPETDETSCLAVTLLRAVGWLSRGDLALRPAHAGPPIETPGAQVPGPHRAELSLRWHPVDAEGRSAEAHRFAYPPLAWQASPCGDGALRDGARLLEVDDPAVVVSAIEPLAGGGCLVRLYNASDRARSVRLRWNGRGGPLREVDLAGRGSAGCASDPDRGSGAPGASELALAPWQIRCLRTPR